MAEGQGRGPESFLPRTVHAIAVSDLVVVDLTTVGALEAIGLRLEDLRDADWSACQHIGDAADTLGLGGLLGPSATGSGTVLAVFLRHAHHGELTLLSSDELDDFSPCQ